MARAFNGSSQGMETAAAIDLSGSDTLSISFWLNTVYAADDDIALEFSTDSNGNNGTFKFIVNESSSDNVWYDQKTVAGPITASGRCADPGNSAWHHIVIVADRSVTTIEVVAIYLDGVSQSLTRLDGNNSGNYGNFILYVMSRASGSLWADGDFAELALWPGTLLDQSDVDALWNSGNGALATVVTPDPSFYWRVLGDDSPEPEFNGGTALTLVGSPGSATHPFLEDPTVVLTGTALDTIDEADIVAGGKTIIATVSSDTFVPAVSTALITHVSTRPQSTTAFTTSFTIALPVTVANDVMLLEYVHRSTNTGGIFGTDGSQTSWTLKHSRTLGAASTFSAHLYWRRATDNHSSQSIAVSSLVNSCAALVSVYRGALASGDPLDSATVVGEWNTAGNEAQVGISTNTASTMVVLVVANSPDFAISAQSSIAIGPLTERNEILNTGGTDASIAHASAIWNGIGDTSTFSWAQTNASSGSFAYAITPLTTAAFDLARQAFIDGFDSAQAEATGWDAEVKAKASVTEVIRTSDNVVTWTIAAQAGYDITAQETITGTIPASILSRAISTLATPTFTIDTGGAPPADEIRILFKYDLKGLAGGVFGGRRSH